MFPVYNRSKIAHIALNACALYLLVKFFREHFSS